jgi:ribonuclease T1
VGIKPSSWKQVILYLVVLVAAYFIFSLASGSSIFPNCAPAAPVPEQEIPAATVNQTTESTGAGVINVADLPPEGRTTLGLIKSDGPFPYSKDGTMFSNYEGLLPAKPGGYYHEYTVITPGSHDRGACRIVAGGSGEYYYTDDHYRSFRLIQE